MEDGEDQLTLKATWRSILKQVTEETILGMSVLCNTYTFYMCTYNAICMCFIYIYEKT